MNENSRPPIDPLEAADDFFNHLQDPNFMNSVFEVLKQRDKDLIEALIASGLDSIRSVTRSLKRSQHKENSIFTSPDCTPQKRRTIDKCLDCCYFITGAVAIYERGLLYRAKGYIDQTIFSSFTDALDAEFDKALKAKGLNAKSLETATKVYRESCDSCPMTTPFELQRMVFVLSLSLFIKVYSMQLRGFEVQDQDIIDLNDAILAGIQDIRIRIPFSLDSVLEFQE